MARRQERMHHNEQGDKSLIQNRKKNVSWKIGYGQYHWRLFSYPFDRQLFGKTQQRRLHIQKCREPENFKLFFFYNFTCGTIASKKLSEFLGKKLISTFGSLPNTALSPPISWLRVWLKEALAVLSRLSFDSFPGPHLKSPVSTLPPSRWISSQVPQSPIDSWI